MSIIEHQLRERIASQGYINIAEFMEMIIPYYYQHNQSIGASGDFITAPEISQLFGEIIAGFLLYHWNMAANPSISLLELGAGRGTLMSDIVRFSCKYPDFQNKYDVKIVEISEHLKAMQQEKLADSKVSWYQNIEEIECNNPLFIIANEFFDALPIRQFVGNAEKILLLNNGKICFDYLGIPEGMQITEISEESLKIMRRICVMLQKNGGVAIIIDYGYDKKGHIDSLQAVKNHQYVDILEHIGEADITAWVDFVALQEVAIDHKLQAKIYTQRDFLIENGIMEYCEFLIQKSGNNSIRNDMQRLIDKNQMGELFKLLIVSK